MTAHIKVSGQWRELTSILIRQGGAWREVAEGFVYKGGGWKSFYANEIVYINTANRTSANIHTLMGSPTKKGNYIFINRATIGASGASFALRTGTFPAGSTLHIINEGNIQGLSGAAGTGGGGGAGGHALYVDFPCTIENASGYIFGGGGGGGRGGDGGGGSYSVTNRDPASGWRYHTKRPSYRWDISYYNNTIPISSVEWNNTKIPGVPVTAASYTYGGYTYLKGPLEHANVSGSSYNHSIARTWTSTANSNGGAGGAGGRGQGSNTSRTNGSAGAAGGTNAGRGGTGGNGGYWGVAGSSGAGGANGNRTNGVAGSSGGTAGRGIVRNGHAVSVVSGSGTDRLKGGIV